MKPIFESKETYLAYATIDACYHQLLEIEKSIDKIVYKENEVRVEYNINITQANIKALISLLKKIVENKKIIEADYTETEKAISQLEKLLVTKSKQEIYTNGLMKFGFAPILYLLEENKKIEKYEECQIIIDLLKKYYTKYKLDLPLDWSNDIPRIYKEAFSEFNLSGETAMSNIPQYALEIQNDLIKNGH